MEGYIWSQYLARQKKTLAEGLGEIIPMARAAGFSNIELNQSFFGSDLRSRLRDLLVAEKLSMPSVYVGGAMHQREAAERTIKSALDIGGFCKSFGCRAVVNNPDPKRPAAPKTDAELALQAGLLNQMGRELKSAGLQFFVHHHSPEMAENAREWRHILKNTDPKLVSLCIDLDWVHQGGQDPLALLEEAGSRAAELHLRNSNNKLWLEVFADGDIDYRKVAAYLNHRKLKPLLVVELAYHPETAVTRSLVDDLRLSREYAERIFEPDAKA
jgi:inosose dehydratase